MAGTAYVKYIKDNGNNSSMEEYSETGKRMLLFIRDNALLDKSGKLAKELSTFFTMTSNMILNKVFVEGKPVAFADIDMLNIKNNLDDILASVEKCNKENIQRAKEIGIKFSIADDGEVKLLEPLGIKKVK